mgnify:CR=1 FL=1
MGHMTHHIDQNWTANLMDIIVTFEDVPKFHFWPFLRPLEARKRQESLKSFKTHENWVMLAVFDKESNEHTCFGRHYFLIIYRKSAYFLPKKLIYRFMVPTFCKIIL